MNLRTKLLLASAPFTFLAMAQMPPLIDRDVLFGNPEIAAAQISPNGEYIAFLKPYQDTRNIWVKKASEPFASARLLTPRPSVPFRPSFGLATASTSLLSRTMMATRTSTFLR